MTSHLKKALRIKGMKFYLSPSDITYGHDITKCVKVKTKKRMTELLKSNRFMNEITQINSDNSCTVIYREKLK
mgnify:CR=1 FL=1|tara:strand:+ start:517 stop:735 length:219 start_codon:yes stop_codon:yes gene_type:complete